MGTANEDPRIRLVARRLGMSAPSTTPLSGGSRNRCYRMRDGTVDVVLRILGEGDDSFSVERNSEALAQRVAAGSGLAPRLLIHDAEAGYMVSAHVSGAVWSRDLARSAEGAARLGAWLARLHAVAAPDGLRRVRFDRVLADYCATLGPGGLAQTLAGCAPRIASSLGAAGPEALCHNDLHHLNLIDAAGGLVAIDWEYAGLGQPVMDLAGYVAYHDLDADAVESLLAGYGPLPWKPSMESLSLARWLFEAVWWAWLEILRRQDKAESAEFAATQARLARRLASVPRLP